jgi:hypothetical protein
MPRFDGIDIYELMPLLGELVLNSINVIEDGALRPPFWKRMCAWIQAGFMLSLMQDLNLDLESFSNWVQSNQTPAGTCAKLLDLHHEPMYSAGEMSQKMFRAEIIGRLLIIRERCKAADQEMLGSEKIDEAVSRLSDKDSLISWNLPGPLEGHRRPIETGKHKLVADHIREIMKDLGNNPSGPALSAIAYLSQGFDVDEEILREVREGIAQIPFDSKGKNLSEHVGRLTDIALAACAKRDINLANVIAEVLLRAAHLVDSDDQVGKIFQGLLIAGGAFEDEDEWARWLGDQLTEFAFRLPAGEPSKMFLRYLSALRIVCKLNLGIHARAEAIASTAN